MPTAISPLRPVPAEAEPFDVLTQALQDLTSGRRTKQSQTVLRIEHVGHGTVTTRMRSVVEEDDRIKFYACRFFLMHDHVLGARVVRSISGRTVRVEVDTIHGAMAFDAPPGMRAPSRRRSSFR